MALFSIDVRNMAEIIDHAVMEITVAYQSKTDHSIGEVNPELLAQGLRQFTEVIKRIEANNGSESDSEDGGTSTTGDDITHLGDYGLTLLLDMGQWAISLQQVKAYQDLNQLYVPVALWIARHGGYINNLEPIVDSLALLANSTKDPDEITEFNDVMGEIINAIAPDIKRDQDKSNSGRPWRVLNLNRCIIATRSNNPKLMESAFNTLIQFLPQDAPSFFNEGMAQMELLDYPIPTRNIMEKFFKLYTMKKLH